MEGRHRISYRRSLGRAGPPTMLLLAFLLVDCSSRPSRLYVLSSLANSPTMSTDATSNRTDTETRSIGKAGAAHVFGVTVYVPEYLDRLDVVRRATDNMVQLNYDVQWAESLSVTATRALVDNLASMLPMADVLAMPSRTRRTSDFQISLDLTRFESETDGLSVIAGRWNITDSNGTERANGRIYRVEPVKKPKDAEEMAEAMSRNLLAASNEIADACRKL